VCEILSGLYNPKADEIARFDMTRMIVSSIIHAVLME
jgi:hypothetical protein